MFIKKLTGYRYLLILFSVFALLFTTNCSKTQSLQGPSLERPHDFDSQVDDLKSKTDDSQKTIPVIVRLKEPFKAEGTLTAVSSLNQRDSIATKQTSVINNLNQKLNNFTEIPITRFQSFPFISLKANSKILDALSEDSDVLEIIEDKPVKGTLSSSTNHIGATKAWQSGYSASGQTVAVIDSGVRLDHEFFSGKIVAEGCYSGAFGYSLCPGGARESTARGSGNDCSTSIPGCGHGTHVAGIAAGKSGVAKGANIIAIKTASNPGNGGEVVHYWSDIVRGFERVYELRNQFKIAAVNLSVGGGSHAGTCDDVYGGLLKQAIDNLKSANIAVIISSGNNLDTSVNANSMAAPACISSAISVANSVGANSSKTYYNGVHFKTDHLWVDSQISTYTDLAAPGADITSSTANSSSSYGSMYGTSMASPHVAGAFAVLRQKAPNASVDQLLNAFKSSGVRIRDQRPHGRYTVTRIDVSRALDQFSNPTPPPPSPQPTPMPQPEQKTASVPKPMSPENETLNTNQPTFTWKSVSGVTSYVLWAQQDSSNRPAIHNVIGSNQADCDNGEDYCTFSIQKLNKSLSNSSYKWRIRAASGAKDSSFSAYMSFSINTSSMPKREPASVKKKPMPISPVQVNLTSRQPTFKWSASGANTYVLYVQHQSSSELSVHNVVGANQARCDKGESECYVSLSFLRKTLSKAGTYTWKVRNADQGSDETFSEQKSFTLNSSGEMTPTTSTPTPLSPSNVLVTSRQPTFKWKAVKGAQSYVIWVKHTGVSFAYIHNVVGANQVNCGEGQSTCTLPLSFLGKSLNNGRYQWKVKVNSNNSAYSSTHEFTKFLYGDR